MMELIIFALLFCLFSIVYGIYLIVSRKNKNLGITLLIIGLVIPLIGLSICGYMLSNLGSMN